MRTSGYRRPRLVLFVVVSLFSIGVGSALAGTKISLDPKTKLELINAQAKFVEYRGRPALNLAPLPGHEHDTDQEILSVIPDLDLTY
jgi:hypothetical protein